MKRSQGFLPAGWRPAAAAGVVFFLVVVMSWLGVQVESIGLVL